jgi:excinuclease ABC subunit A
MGLREGVIGLWFERMEREVIRVRGARQHNLQDVNVDLPRGQLVVLTGVSGSGKSSLAFDTLYAEGQRRYVQSLSAYARQFLDKLEKPDVDFIEGLSPAVAIEQAHSTPNPRSTIATVTEIYDYLRVLYSVAGRPHDPETGEALVRDTPAEIGEKILAEPEGTRIVVLASVAKSEEGDLRGLMEKLRRQGYVRVRLDGEILELSEELRPERGVPHDLEVVVDRLVVREGVQARLMEAIEAALKWNEHEIAFALSARGQEERLRVFTTAYANPRTGFLMEKLTPQHFSFNTHVGACPRCEGVGTVPRADPELLVPDPTKSIKDGAIKSWWARQPKLKAVQMSSIEALARHFDVDLSVPYERLPEPFRRALMRGTQEAVATGWKTGSHKRSLAKPFEGLQDQVERMHESAQSEALRSRLSRLMNRETCPECQGRRLRPEALAVRLESTGPLGSLAIHEFAALQIDQALEWLEALLVEAGQETYVGELQREILNRVRFLHDVGLGYLTLDRESGTLSGGEMQRIRLATQIGAGLAGVLYVLDEPSIGLHPADNERLIGTLKRLRDLGNTVLVVEHDEDTIRSADHIVELGPGAGPLGGKVTAQGTPGELTESDGSLTGSYLSGRSRIPLPKRRVAPRGATELALEDAVETGWLTIHEASENNLQNVTASFPLGCFVCVTGASGSGKSTLVDDILMRALKRHFYRAKEPPGKHDRITGLNGIDKVIVIDQSPIGRSPRSNPATYTGAFGAIRELFAQLPMARVRGYDAGRFSFNVAGGRCEKCAGDGVLKIDMHFLADVYVTCSQCQGRRYNSETLEVTYKGRSIAEVLEMTIAAAARFFAHHPSIEPRLRALEEVGLGYLKLGQPGNTLSGGEAQRVKIAAELSKKATSRTLYVLDEPTTGLHLADIATLLKVLLRLRDAGNTLIVIEHHLDVIKCADWVLDLGPGGGRLGGQIVAEGTPEEVAECAQSSTGGFLRRLLSR